jgi:hypothetical protein
MSRLNDLIRHYEHFVSLPWKKEISGVLKVWFVIYDKEDERRFRAKVDEFELATKQAGHSWVLIDLTNAFAQWMATNEYAEDYFEEPDYLDDMALQGFRDNIRQLIQETLQTPSTDENTIVAVQGVACLFGFTKVSELVKELEEAIRGRLVVFFPGEYEHNNYRLLDARDGWNYLAVPITAHNSNGVES